MKITSFISFMLLVIASINSVSCSKSASSSATPSGTKTTWNDGTNQTADSTIAMLYTSSGARVMDIFVFKGEMKDPAGITFGISPLEMHISPKSGVQTVKAAPNNAWLTFFDYHNGNINLPVDVYDGATGNFNLTACDTTKVTITGTFDFTGQYYNLLTRAYDASKTKAITNGNLVVDKIYRQ